MNLITSLRLIYKLQAAYEGISDNLRDEIADRIRSGNGYSSIYEDIKRKYGIEVPFSVYIEVEHTIKGDTEGKPSEIVFPEGSTGDLEIGYGGDRPGVFVAPKTSSLNLLSVAADEIITEEVKKLKEHNFSSAEVKELADMYAEEFREKTNKFLNAEEELDDFLEFVKRKIDKKLGIVGERHE